METRERQWKQWRPRVVFLVVFYLWMDLHDILIKAHTIANETQATFCEAQCEALHLDCPSCECIGPKYWYSTCNEPVCEGTCSVLRKSFDKNHDRLPIVPLLNISLSGYRGIELSWQRSPFSSNLTTIYIIEESRPLPYMMQLSSYKIVGWVRDNKYRINGYEACSPNSYRIMAINRYGTSGFSDSVKSIGLRPGRVKNIHYAGAGVYFYQDKDPTVSRFMAILQWDEPAGWSSDEIKFYEWNPLTPHKCLEMSQNSLPLFHRMENQTNHILMTIAAMSIGCTYKAQVRAVSVCNQTGPWTDFTVDLTDCNQIVGYKCQDELFDPPGQVENVSLSIWATPLSALMNFTKHPFTINPASPLNINLHVCWEEPSDLGSTKLIERYIVRSGPAQMNFFPIPPTFTETPNVKRLSGNIRELIFQLPTYKVPYTYGVQVVAVAPDQKIPDNEWGLFPVYTIQVARNDSLAELKQKGKILLDEGGIVIVYVNNTLPVIFDTPIGKMSNSTVNRYALQWGPLVGPKSNEMLVENRTIVPLETKILLLHLNEPHRRYGIQVRGLSEEQEDPDEEVWDDIPLLSFSLPLETDEILIEENRQGSSMSRFIPLYVAAPVILGMICLAMLLRHHQKQKHNFKHLERRLAEDMDVDSETGDHYFIMRTAGNQSDVDDQVTTVVADRWELPHTCIKVGRVLGSGAFGQVVKGRVSRSVLQSRGIDLHGQRAGQGMHVTVAVKMLQECPEERYSNDFLREIQMMKDIGYHRNIVSLLGCCTLREPFCLIVEHVPNGDLLTHLRKIRNTVEQRAEQFGSYVNQEVELFSPHTLLSYARQIVTGMEYLSQKGFVHRDLAARNILVGDNSTVKIADFGLARYIYYDVGKVYVNRNGGKLPVKWMAPESIFNQIFSTASDIWSFGILLFEIVTLGAMPYPQLSYTDLLQALKQDYIMEKPSNCSDEIYDIMKNCWNYNPGCRPSFTRLKEIFTFLLEEDSGLEYFDFKVHEDRLYYRINSDELDVDNVDNTDQDGSDHVAMTEHNHCQTQLSSTQAVFELGSDSISIENTPTHSRSTEVDKDPLDLDTGYSDKAFIRKTSTTSSFHNELYSDTIGDRIVGTSPNQTTLRLSEGVEDEFDQEQDTDIASMHQGCKEDMDADSYSVSDDVFEECHGCRSTQTSSVENIKDPSCNVCNKLDIDLNHFDIHVSGRNDSAIGSDNSSGRYHTDSSNCSVNSNEYLMPDSPLTYDMENDFDISPDYLVPDEYLSRQLSIDKYPRLVYDYHFINLNRNSETVNDNIRFFSSQNDTHRDDNSADDNQNGSSKIDIWCIAETKM